MSRKIPPGHLHVRERRRRGVAARDPHEMRLADRAARDRVVHGLVRGVEAAVEADLERDARGLHLGQRAVDLGQVERHRLLAEDRLARPRGRGDQLGVRVGARADGDRVGVAGERLLDAHGGHARARRRRRAAVGPAASATPVSSAPATRRASSSACMLPIRPTPITAIRTGQASRSDTTSSQRPDAAERSSAAWTDTQASASSNPGANGRRSATASQNAASSIVTRSS